MTETFYKRTGKQVFDFAVALVGVILISPLFVIIALSVRAKLGAPVIFRQRRPGRDGTLFTLLKFRTMLDLGDSPADSSGDAERLTAFGRALRSLSLDELPELVNVLRGEMSLVGPRPLLTQYLDRYTPSQQRRHEVRPGITGWAQINGRNSSSWPERLAADVWYVDHVSFALDLKILLLTVKKVFAREGITAQGHATMAEFMGDHR